MDWTRILAEAGITESPGRQEAVVAAKAFTEKRNPNYNPFGEQGGSGYQRSSNQDWQKVLGSVEQSGMHTMQRDSSFNGDASGQSNQISGLNNPNSDTNADTNGYSNIHTYTNTFCNTKLPTNGYFIEQ